MAEVRSVAEVPAGACQGKVMAAGSQSRNRGCSSDG
jgi:hypothetical protein